MVVAAFVAPYLLEATARFALSAARVSGVRLGLVTTESAGNLSPTCGLRWRITGRSPTRWTPSRSPMPSGPQRSDRSGRAVDRRLGAAAGAAGTFTHMEWFARPDGSAAVSEVGARPPGAQLASMIGFSHDIDFYSMWAKLVLLGTFNAPDRVSATGTAYLRGQGRGRVRTVHGVDEMQRELGHLVVDARLPRPGQPASTSYEGEGFVTVRHENTAVVRAALDRIISELRVELVETE